MHNIIFMILFALNSFDFLEPKQEYNQPKSILYFTAEWCGPCKSFKDKELPKLKNINIQVYDIDKSKDVYSKWKKTSNSIPLFIFIGQDGKEYSRIIGYQSAENIIKFWNQK